MRFRRLLCKNKISRPILVSCHQIFDSYFSIVISLSHKYSFESQPTTNLTFFRYYSINSVCIPKFFVKSSDSSWGFSFFVNLFNFCSFVFVATAYATIYYQSRKRAKVRTTTRKADKGVTGRVINMYFLPSLMDSEESKEQSNPYE